VFFSGESYHFARVFGKEEVVHLDQVTERGYIREKEMEQVS
jgi:hypothetical protein